MHQPRTFMQRVINIPEKMETGIFAAILFITVQAELLFLQVTGVEITGLLAVVAAVIAPIITGILKITLEKVVPLALHPVVNSILVFLAGFLGALALIAYAV